MKSGPFLDLIARALPTPASSVKVYARALKEAGLLTSGPGGINAPHMTPLDAARLVLAILTTNKPAECVERVRRFGPIAYSPGYVSNCVWRETIQPDEFRRIFEGDTLEEVLAYVFGMPARVGIDEACKWSLANVFHLDVYDFEVRAELVAWKMDGGKVLAERIVPFKGAVMVKGEDGKFRHVEGFTPIKASPEGRRRLSTNAFLQIGIGLMADDGGISDDE